MDDLPPSSRESAIVHLEDALDADTPVDKDIHIRQALQHLQIEE